MPRGGDECVAFASFLPPASTSSAKRQQRVKLPCLQAVLRLILAPMASASKTAYPKARTTQHQAQARQASPESAATTPPPGTSARAFTVGYIRGDTKSPLTCPPLWTASIVHSPFAAWGCCNTQDECNAFWGTCSTYVSDGISGDIGGSAVSCSSGNPKCVRFILSTNADDGAPVASYGCGLVSSDIPVLARATGAIESRSSDVPASSLASPSSSGNVVQTTTPSSASSSQLLSSSGSRHSQISGGAIAGIVVGAVAVLALLAAGGYLWRRHQKSRMRQMLPAAAGTVSESDSNDDPSTQAIHLTDQRKPEASDGFQARIPQYRHECTVAIICALVIESNSVLEAMDETWEDDNIADRDGNRYTHGRISTHKVVLVYSPGSGQTTTAISVKELQSVYPNIKLALVVGVCGAVPKTHEGHDIFLGDLIISTATVTVDFGRQYEEEFQRYNTDRNPRASVKSLLNMIQGRARLRKLRAELAENLQQIQNRRMQDEMDTPCVGEDVENLVDELFDPTRLHKHNDKHIQGDPCECLTNTNNICAAARDIPCKDLGCDKTQLVPRDSRAGRYDDAGHFQPRIHFGCVGSGNALMRSGKLRDRIAAREKLIAYEMEGAAVYQVYDSTIIIKAACDYADSHKGKAWQRRAADVAAAGMKALLAVY